MYPKIKAVGDFDPKYANLLEPAIRNNIKPGTIYIERVGVWWCVFIGRHAKARELQSTVRRCRCC
jgi:hypothetical protein